MLHVVEFGELAPIVRRDKLLELLVGLASQIAAIDKKVDVAVSRLRISSRNSVSIKAGRFQAVDDGPPTTIPLSIPARGAK